MLWHKGAERIHVIRYTIYNDETIKSTSHNVHTTDSWDRLFI